MQKKEIIFSYTENILVKIGMIYFGLIGSIILLKIGFSIIGIIGAIVFGITGFIIGWLIGGTITGAMIGIAKTIHSLFLKNK